MRLLVAVALVVGCRGDRTHAAGSSGSAVVVPDARAAEIVPKLPASPDGVAELRVLDAEIDRARDGSHRETYGELLLERASIRGRLEDYVAAAEVSDALVRATPGSLVAWTLRTRTLTRIHRFAEARRALSRVSELTTDPNEAAELAATLDEATGEHARAAAYREHAATTWPNPTHLVLYAGNLALAGRLDDALAVMPKAAATIRMNPAKLLSWILFQWARLYEQQGELAAARRFLQAAHARLPGSLETTVHLAEAMRATGDDPSKLVAEALADNPHPELLALAGRTAEARTAWERYVTALPEAFADHAARFYLKAGADPGRALVLARANLANRTTNEARALLIEAALAAGQHAVACEVAPTLARGTRVQQFLAWRAFSTCKLSVEADRLALRLGISGR